MALDKQHLDLSQLYDGLPLDPSQRQIRVLTISRNDKTNNANHGVSCSLKVISLGNSNVKFNALSYVWGDPNDTVDITVNGVAISITKTLEGALRNLRNLLSSDDIPAELLFDDHQSVVIWADAVCIDQTNPQEKRQQVGMMGEIYTITSNVVVWLGEGDEHTNFALDRMNSSELRKGLPYEWSTAERPPTEEEIKVEVVLKQVLCRRPWWKRLWVRQEFILVDNEPFFMCGSRITNGWDLFECFMCLPRAWDHVELAGTYTKYQRQVLGTESTHNLYSTAQNTGAHPLSLHNVRRTLKHMAFQRPDQRFGGFPLTYAIKYILLHSAATDPRDYIYGLLGLLRQLDRDQITLDYDLEPMEIFQQVSRVLWNQYWTSMPTLLPFIEFRQGPELDEDHPAHDYYRYPSWVPDFSAQPIRGWKDNSSLISHDLPWPQSVQRQPPLRPDDLSTVVLQGTSFDTIKTSIATPQDFTTLEELIPFLQDVDALMQKAIHQPIPPCHRLNPLEYLKHHEGIVHTLTRNGSQARSDRKPLVPHMKDDDLWDVLLGKTSTLPTAAPSDHLRPTPGLTRLTTALRGKFLSRRILITETGFVGIGTRQIRDGDVVTSVFGSPAPLVFRRHQFREGYYTMVGSAYVSGLMDRSTSRLGGDVLEAVLGAEEFSVC